MEIMSPRPPQEFLLDSAAAGAYTPKSAIIMNPFASTDDVAAGAGNPFLATTAAVTAPPSPNPFEQLPPGASDADPFDLFQHFTSAPTSPARAAAIYAQFDGANSGGGGKDDVDCDDDLGYCFQPRVSYSMSKSMVTSTVPFDWEEKPGKPKAEFAGVAATTTTVDDDADFDFGVLLDKASAQAQELTTADELFDEGKIRPLKPPPRLLDGGSVGSSPRSARSVMSCSPRLRGRLTGGPGSASANASFDPFAAALAKAAANAPSSPLGGGAGTKHDAGGGGVVSATFPPMDPDVVATSPRSSTPPGAGNGSGGRKKWRLRDLLLFRRATKGLTAAGNVSKDPVFKYAPVQVQQLGTPVKTASAGPVAADGDASAGKHKKQSKKAAPPAEGGGMPMPRRQNVMGCVRLHPGLHRLAKGFHGHSAHLGGRGAAKSAT